MNKWFKTPSSEELARKAYEEAQRELLVAEEAVELWTAKRSAIKQKIERLGKVVNHA